MACSMYSFLFHFAMPDVMLLAFIHVLVHPFLLLNGIPWMDHGLFIYSPVVPLILHILLLNLYTLKIYIFYIVYLILLFRNQLMLVLNKKLFLQVCLLFLLLVLSAILLF